MNAEELRESFLRHVALPAVLLALPACQGRPLNAQIEGAFEELRRFSAPEAHQAVAVDDRHFYAITNRRIGKYEKDTGARIMEWEASATGPFIHLNSGVVLDGLLYCAHSNYPGVPMVSSIEVFDVETLEHVSSHTFGVMAGSATWIDRHDDLWWVAFANYEGRGGTPGRGPEWTTLISFEDDWRQVQGYMFPDAIVQSFDHMSTSGGTFGPDGLLYITGHDAAEIYVLGLPTAGSVLEHVGTLSVAAEGQGIAFDRSAPGVLYTILRSTNEVVVSQLTTTAPVGGS